MYTLHRFDYFMHENFGIGVVLSDENSIKRGQSIDAYFIGDKTCRTLSKQFILDNASFDISKVKLSDILTDVFIDQLFDSWTQTKGSKYVSDTRINILYEDKYSVKASVIGTQKYQIEIKSKDSHLSLSCSCPVNDECKHLYAVMKYLSMKYSGNLSKEKTPFENEFDKLLDSTPKEYYPLGFEVVSLFKEDADNNTKTVYRFLNDYDYYSNKAFIPLVMDEEVFKKLIENANYQQRLSLNRVYQRYEKAVEGRNYSFDDVILALIFKKRYEEIFTKNFTSYLRFSSLTKEGILFAAKQIDITPDVASILAKLSLEKGEVREIFDLAKNKQSKRLIYMSFQEYLSNLGEDILRELDYTAEDVYQLFVNSSVKEKTNLLLNNYKLFIKDGKEEYLPSMVNEVLNNPNIARTYFNDLYRIIEELDNNELLLKLDFKQEDYEPEYFLHRWRNGTW